MKQKKRQMIVAVMEHPVTPWLAIVALLLLLFGSAVTQAKADELGDLGVEINDRLVRIEAMIGGAIDEDDQEMITIGISQLAAAKELIEATIGIINDREIYRAEMEEIKTRNRDARIMDRAVF